MQNATIETYFSLFIAIINRTLIPAIFALAFVVFIFYIYKYFIAGGSSDDERKKGRAFLLWSVIAFAIMISIWGIVNVLVNTFGFGSGQSRPALPTFGDTGASSGRTTGGGASSDIIVTPTSSNNPFAPTPPMDTSIPSKL